MMTLEPIVTRVAHTGTDELRFHSHRVFAELLGNSSVAQMLVLGISGHRLDGDDAAVIDDLVTVMSSADPRMWPFKITRLGSAFGSAARGTAATLVAAEGGLFGPNRMRAAATWLVQLKQVHDGTPLDDDALLATLDSGAHAFGVLYRNRDERFEALVRQLVVRGRDRRPYAELCLRAVKLAREHRKLEPHVFLGVAATCLDLGLSVDAVAAFATVLLFHDALANAVEGARQQPVALRRLPEDVLEYRGVQARTSPRNSPSR